MQNFFPHIDLEYYVFLDLTKNSKSDVDERGHRLRFFHTLRRGPNLPTVVSSCAVEKNSNDIQVRKNEVSFLYQL